MIAITPKISNPIVSRNAFVVRLVSCVLVINLFVISIAGLSLHQALFLVGTVSASLLLYCNWLREKQSLDELIRYRDQLEVLVKERTSEIEVKNEQYEEAQRIAHIGSWEVDHLSGRLLWSNETYRILGVAPEFEPHYQDFLNAVHPNDRENVDIAYTNSVRERSLYSLTFRVLRSGGQIRFVHSFGETSYSETGNPLRSRGTVQDITELKEVENALRTSDERLSLALAASKLGVWEWNVQTNRVFWSPECFEIFHAENFNGTHADFINVVHPDDICRLMDASVQAMTENMICSLEYRIIIPDGQVRWLLGFARPTYDENGRPHRLIGTVHDITDRKQAEVALRNNEEQLRHYLGKVRRLSMHMETIREDERAHIARNIHDELGQMLTALHFDLEWLKNRLPESAKECIQKIAEMNGHVTSTKETIHRITADLRPRLLDDLGLVPAMIWQTKEFARRVGIPCRFNPEGSMDYVTGVHATAIFRILQEALTNVARHSDATMVQVYFRHECGQTILEIIDNGKGILPEQLDSEQSFGLMGVRERVQMCDGDVEIMGQPGKGTTIRVSMPVSRKDALCNEDPYS